MQTHGIDVALRSLAAATLLGVLLAGCGKPAQPETVPAPPPAPAQAPTATPGTEVAPANPTENPAAPAQPAPTAPPPTDPSAAPKPTASNEPAIESMSAAKASAKISVPVDLRYQFDGPVLPNQPVMLHLAATSRASGSNLKVSIKPVSGLTVAANDLAVQKVNAAGIYRQQLSITATDGAPTELRVLVTMEIGEASGFGFFTVPLASGTAAQKRESVKQR